MLEIGKAKILAGRNRVDAYRTAHAQLYLNPWHKGFPEEHTLLVNSLIAALEKQGFNSIGLFFEASNELCIEASGIYDHDVYKFRKDSAMLGEPVVSGGVELKEIATGMVLIIDGKTVMDTPPAEHVTMMRSVDECPSGARVFIAGLGLGLVLLYLTHSGKAREIIVCEVDSRVIDLLGQRITDYIDMPIRIIEGDAFEKIKELGRFDWIFFDTGAKEQAELIETVIDYLEPSGVYTDWANLYQPEWR